MSSIEILMILLSIVVGAVLGWFISEGIKLIERTIHSMIVEHENKKYHAQRKLYVEEKLLIEKNSVQIQRHIRKSAVLYTNWAKNFTNSDKMREIAAIAQSLSIEKFNTEMIIKNIDYRIASA